jgi:two-component system chemotaxis response regulator CheY
MRTKILIVDDSLYMQTVIKDTLSGAGYEVVGTAATGESALQKTFDLEPDLITLDNILPDMLGTDVLRLLRDEGVAASVLMISAVGQQPVVTAALGLGAADYLVKPFTPEQLLAAVQKATAEA